MDIPGRGVLDFDWNPGLPVVLEVECTSRSSLTSLIRYLGIRKPSAEERHRAKLEGQYESIYRGIDRSALREQIMSQGLEFTSANRDLRVMIKEQDDLAKFDAMLRKQLDLVKKLRKK